MKTSILLIIKIEMIKFFKRNDMLAVLGIVAVGFIYALSMRGGGYSGKENQSALFWVGIQLLTATALFIGPVIMSFVGTQMLEKLAGVLQAAVNFIYTTKRYIFISAEKAKIQLCCENIMYFECDRRKINVYTIEGNYVFYAKMSAVAGMVDNSWFVRIHVSYLINMDYVKAIYPEEVLLNNGTHLPVSKKYRKSVKMEYLKYTKWRIGL